MDTEECCWKCRYERFQRCHRHAPVCSPDDESAWWPFLGSDWETCGDWESKVKEKD